MTDLISRQDAIALLVKLLCDGEEYYNDGYDRALDEAIKALTNMPSADTLATNEINALKDALAQEEGEIADLQRSLECWQEPWKRMGIKP